MKFPIKFNCGHCAQEHEANFGAAFVADDQGNWYFDLGTKKGWVVVSPKQKQRLNKMLGNQVQAVCSKHTKDIKLSRSGQRIWPRE